MKSLTTKTIRGVTIATTIVGALIGMTHNNLAHAASQAASDKPVTKTIRLNSGGFKNGLYVAPNAELFFINQSYTKDSSATGIGGGVGIDIGYRMNKLLFDLSVGYQYYSSKDTIGQSFARTGRGSLIRQTIPQAANSIYFTTTDNRESFIPVTLGVKYTLGIFDNKLLTLTPGIAGGVWFHNIKRDLSYSDNQDGNVARSFAGLNNLFDVATPTTDNADQIRGVIVPSLSLDYTPTSNLTLSLAGKLYLVPGGYSDNYNPINQAAAADSVNAFTVNYTAVNKLFWYGGISLGARYSF
ncbi:MAG: hypothetical protein QM529_04210 [Hydrotalea sp.]|nr:hypothetical protein [Hydrotalea sp.]